MHIGRLTKRLSMAAVALCLWAAGPAWAGDGESVGSVQTLLGRADGTSGICHLLAINPCPQLPTLTQLVLQFAAVVNSPPDLIRSPQGASLIGGEGFCSVAGNQDLVPCRTVVVNAFNRATPGAILSGGFSAPDLSSLTALSFVSPTNGAGQAVAVPPGANAHPNSFFYAVATTSSGNPGQPDSLTFTYDYIPLTAARFFKGQQVASIALPLVLQDASTGSRQSVPATLQITASCAGGTTCLTAAVIGNFAGNGMQMKSPGDLGLKWGLVFAPSVNAPNLPHAIFQVQAPLLVSHTVDAAYFGVVPVGATTDGVTPDPNIGSSTGVNQLSGVPTAFLKDSNGFLFRNGVFTGIAPYASPQTPSGVTATDTTSSTYGFCASFWGGSAMTLTLNPAVATFVSLATDGTTYVSSPVPPPSRLTCAL
jgi:hypothetical protein